MKTKIILFVILLTSFSVLEANAQQVVEPKSPTTERFATDLDVGVSTEALFLGTNVTLRYAIDFNKYISWDAIGLRVGFGNEWHSSLGNPTQHQGFNSGQPYYYYSFQTVINHKSYPLVHLMTGLHLFPFGSSYYY